MAQPLTAKLNVAVRNIENLKAEFGVYKSKSQEAMQFLRLQNAELREKLDVEKKETQNQVEWLAKVLGVGDALNGEMGGDIEAEEQQP